MLREGRQLLSVMELAALMASISSVVIIFFVVCPTAWCNGVTSSTFMMTKDKQLPSDACQEMGGSRRMSRVQCAGACGVTAGCQSFSFTCADLHLGFSCRCFVCSAADLGAASTSLEATSGVLTSQAILQSLSSETTPMASTTGAPQTTTVISTVPTTQPTTTATETTSAPEPTTAETTTPGPSCSPPPLIDRTTVTHTTTPTHDVGHYACSVNTDVYVQGVVDVTCTDGATWTIATILCAPTTCWYTHPTYGPVYAGTLSYTTDGTECQAWALNSPKTKNQMYEPDSMYPSDNNSKTAASNYCRIFDDNYAAVWCYMNRFSLLKFKPCDVPKCGVVPATTCWYTHPTYGPVYAGNLTHTADGTECQAWALNYPYEKTSIYEPDSMYPSDNNSKTAASNYCRTFDDGYGDVWCYWTKPPSNYNNANYGLCDVQSCGVVLGQRRP